MHILEIENLINRLQKSQISLIELLKQDAEFCALTELQFRENAAIPFAVVRGAKLRRKLNRKFGGRPVSGDMHRLDKELAEIEHTIASVASVNLLPSVEKPDVAQAQEIPAEAPVEVADKVLIEPTEVKSGAMSICQQAADRAEALAKLSNLKFTHSEAEIIAVGAPSIEDIQRINIEKNQPVETEVLIDFAEADEIDEAPANEEIAVQDVHYLPTSSALARVGRGIAFAVVALITIVTISSTHPEPAKASMQMFNSLYSAALTCCNIEVSAANLR